MTIRQRRLENGWSQLQLAEFSGLSLRTIQRIEKGLTPTIESLKSLAAVFDIDFNELIDQDMAEIDESQLDEEGMAELKHIREVQRLLKDALIFVVCIPLALLLYTVDMTESFRGWVLWMLLGWGIYLVVDAFYVFDARDFFGRGWEKRMLEKRLGRKVD